MPYSHDGKLRRKRRENRKRKRSDGRGAISLYKYDSVALPSFHEPETFVKIVIIIRQIIRRGYRTVPIDITSAPCYGKLAYISYLHLKYLFQSKIDANLERAVSPCCPSVNTIM
jgi:hypothetical protein